MEIFDISLPIYNGMTVYEGSPATEIQTKTIVGEHGVGFSTFFFGSHTGTHIDAPSHFIDGGLSIDTIDLQKCFGKCKVIDVTGIDHLEIMPADFSSVDIGQGDRILFKTKNAFMDRSKFPEKFTSLSLEAAQLLVKKGVVLVGTDFLGIEKRKNPGHPVHTMLLSSNIIIVEGLDLSKVEAGEYQLSCLPIKVQNADGAPARAILIK